jgi:hypothetical protein
MKLSLFCPPHHLNLKTKASWSTDWRKHRLELYDPSNTDMHHQRMLPRGAVVATGAPLSPSGPDDDVWWQLSEADRRVFRLIFFRVVISAGGSVKRAMVIWLRWAAVRQAHFSDGIPWSKAYAAAATRL